MFTAKGFGKEDGELGCAECSSTVLAAGRLVLCRYPAVGQPLTVL